MFVYFSLMFGLLLLSDFVVLGVYGLVWLIDLWLVDLF